MKQKKMLLLAAVVTAVSVLAIPALASALVWKDHGTKVTKLVEIGLTGGELWEVPGTGGMSCEVKGKLSIENETTAKITAFESVKCPTGFEGFAKCEVSTTTVKGLPWTVDINAANDLTITGMHIKRTFKAGCATVEVDKTVNVTVTLETPTEIAEMEWSGETAGFKSTGSFTVEGTNSGTYGIA
jgi:hypothetical protein